MEILVALFSVGYTIFWISDLLSNPLKDINDNETYSSIAMIALLFSSFLIELPLILFFDFFSSFFGLLTLIIGAIIITIIIVNIVETIRKKERDKIEEAEKKIKEREEKEQNKTIAELTASLQEILARRPKVKKKKRVDYKTYINSTEWDQKRREAYRRANYKCQTCWGRGELHAHHQTYKRLGDEDPDDLIVLCQDCHDDLHDNIKIK